MKLRTAAGEPTGNATPNRTPFPIVSGPDFLYEGRYEQPTASGKAPWRRAQRMSVREGGKSA